MKKVIVTYFKESGKYYTQDEIMISEELSGYHALFEEIPKHLRMRNEMTAVVTDGDGSKEPYIVPHMYYPVK